MKAIHLVPAMAEGGVERYVVQLNRILVGAGWENVVVSRGGWLDADIEKGGGRVVHQEMKSKNPLTVLGRAWRLRQLLKRERPDVVCAHSRVPAWLFVMASRGLGIKWITYAHGANSISRYSRVMTRGDLIMCPSNFVREYLKNAYGVDESRFRVVPHGIDATRFDPAKVDAAFVAAKRREWGIGPDTKVVMSIGRITRLKGFDTLIRAFERLRPKAEIAGAKRTACVKVEGQDQEKVKAPGSSCLVPGVEETPSTKHAVRGEQRKLIIVGGAERGKEAYLGELKALVRELGLESIVVFAGRQTKTPECLSLADVVVSANTTKPESFGLTMAEALMMGKYVVAKAFGGALDIVRDGLDGVLVGSEKGKVKSEVIEITSSEKVAAAFAEAIEKILRSTSDLQSPTSIRASAQKRFDFGIMAAKTLAVYEEVAR